MNIRTSKTDIVTNIIDTCSSIVRIALLSKFLKKTKQISRKSDKCIILGNGPSLSKLLSDNKEKLNNYDLIAINHLGVSAEYVQYKPSVYILCDPAFWYAVESENVKEKTSRLYSAIVNVTDWDLQLYLPHLAKKRPDVIEQLSQNKHIHIKFYNKTKFEGLASMSHFVYDKQWGMPRAQNVLIAALMLAIYSQYKKIYLFGAENSWLKNLWVDDSNNIRFSFTHCYKESLKETEYNSSSQKLHEVLQSLVYAFKSYTQVEIYAKKYGIKIYNTTPDSYIDAFERHFILD